MRARMKSSVLRDIETAKTDAQAFDRLVAFSRDIEIDLVSYHRFTPLNILPNVPRHSQFELMVHGFPDDWVQTYMHSDYRRIDPITGLAACLTRPILWSEVPDEVRLTEEQTDYMRALYDWLDPGDGLAVPLFGPSGRHGYAGMGWTGQMEPWDEAEIRIIQAICESFHLRICELHLADDDSVVTLTQRQKRLLRALATGQPDALIGGMVNLRPEPLNSAIAGLLRALNVTDRPSALLRARALGLLDR